MICSFEHTCRLMRYFAAFAVYSSTSHVINQCILSVFTPSVLLFVLFICISKLAAYLSRACCFCPTVPPAPILQLEPLNCTSIVARWQLSPESVAVQGYRLCYHEEGHPEQPTIQLQAQNYTYTISGLGERWRCTVVVIWSPLI